MSSPGDLVSVRWRGSRLRIVVADRVAPCLVLGGGVLGGGVRGGVIAPHVYPPSRLRIDATLTPRRHGGNCGGMSVGAVIAPHERVVAPRVLASRFVRPQRVLF